MRMMMRKGSALLMVMILVLQSVFTIPVGAEGRTPSSGSFGLGSAELVDVDGKLVTAVEQSERYQIRLFLSGLLQEVPGESSLTLVLPDFFALALPEGETQGEELYRITPSESGGGVVDIALNKEIPLNSTISVPVQYNGESGQVDGLKLTQVGGSYVLALKESALVEEAPSKVPSVLPAEEAIENLSLQEDLTFISILFTDENGNEYTAENPYDLEGKEIGRIQFHWALSEGHTVKGGDTYSFPLPKELKPVSGTMGALGDVGTWSVSPEGMVTFLFNDNVDGDNVDGSFWFSVYLDEKEIEGNTIQVIVFEGNPDFELTFPVKPKGGTAIDKKGTINREGFNATEAYWTVDVNTALQKMKDPSVKEKIPTNMVFEPGSLTIRRLDVNVFGERTAGEILPSDRYEVVMVSGNPQIIFRNLTDEELSRAYRLEYTTTIVEPAAGFSGTQTFRNEAVLVSGGQETKASSTVSSGYGVALKKGNPVYDAVKQEFSWTIEYNYNEKFIPVAYATLTDTWTPEGTMKLTPDSFGVYPVEIDDKGNATVSSVEADAALYTLLEVPGKGFTLSFKEDVEGQAYVIRYKTKLVNAAGDPVITASGTVANKVVTGQGKQSGGSGSFGQQGLVKRRVSTNVGSKTVGWEIKINQNSYVMENLVLTDVFKGDGMTLLPDTLAIRRSSGEVLLQGTDYVLEYTAPAVKVPGSFTIRFLKTVSEPLVMTYTTHFERNSDGTAEYGNTAGITWSYGGTGYEIKDITVNTKPGGYTGPNGVKSGQYNAVEKKITWSVHTNFARLPLEEPYEITDTLATNQELVEDSLSVFSYEVNASGQMFNEKALDPDNYVVSYLEEESGNKLKVEIKNLAGTRTAVGIRFKTQFKNGLIDTPEVANTATFTSGENTFSLSAKVTIPYGGKLADKKGVQAGAFNERADWTVYLNPSQSRITDYVLKDNPDLNSILLKETFILVKGIVSANGTITKSATVLEKGKDYTLEFFSDPVTGYEQFELKFLYEIEDAYILSYSSYIDPLAPQGEGIRNAYTATGKNVQEDLSGNSTSVIVKVNDGGGTGQSIRGGLSLTKTSEAGEVLSGGLFRLYTSDGKQLLREAVTDASGTLVFGGLRRGKYLLKEITAPEGYVISSALAAGILVELTHTVDGELKAVTYANEKTKATIRKVDASGRLLQDPAVFDLYKADGTLLKQNLTTVSGVLLLEDLAPGRYYVVETSAPDGFILNTQKHYFDIRIEADGTQMKPVVDVKNYKGSALLKKTDRFGGALTGAEFSLLDGRGAVLREKLSVNAQGELLLTALAPGSYELVETKAANGYLLNTQGVVFTIPEKVEGAPQRISLGSFMNYKGAARLYKTDASGAPLSGAVFKVVDSLGRTVLENLTSGEDGRVHALELSPGTYSFVETKAPKGYVLDKTPKPFEIRSSSFGEPAMAIAGDRINYQGSVRMLKVSEEGKPLTGAEFALYEILSGTRVLVGKYTSTSLGWVTAGNLAPGHYEFVEIKAPQGYVRNETPVTFEILPEAEGEPLQVDAGRAVNFKGEVSLTKTGEGDAVQRGAVFSLYQEDGTLQRENLITNEDGLLRVENLSPGRYYFLETQAPAGYIRNEAPVTFEITEAAPGKPQAVSVIYKNYKSSVLLMKEDEEGRGLEGAVFALYSSEGVVLREGLTSMEDGSLRIGSLEPGRYLLRETKAPEGYTRNTTEISFDIPESAEGEPEVLLLGSFVNYKGSAVLTKVSEQGTLLAGAMFELRTGDGQEVLRENLMTGSEGKLEVSDLAPGTYRLYEVKAPEGYLRNLLPVTFVISEEAAGKPDPVAVGPVVNHQGAAQLLKTDALGNPLTGAEFALYDQEGAILWEGLTSDEEGVVRLSGLAPGSYELKETKAPAGYLLNERSVRFTIGDTYTGEPEVLDLASFTNHRGSAFMKKTDAEGSPLESARFGLYQDNGLMLQDDLYSDEAGYVTAEDLAPGRYYFLELEAPSGYIRNTEKIPFIIEESALDGPVAVDAGELLNYKGSATLKKTSPEGKGLAGAVFALYNEEGALLIDGLTSGEDGILHLEQLAPGRYTLVETKAPEGYVRTTEIFTLEIVDEAEGQPETVLMENILNYQGSVLLQKVSEEGNPLAGAVFELLRGEESMGLYQTDELGQILVENLIPGEYTFRETEAPEGYIIDKTPLMFTVSDEAQGEPERILVGAVKNWQGQILLKKTSEDGKALSGAVFELRNLSGNLVREGLVSDEEGLVRVSGLFPGSYVLREVQAPQGYIRNEKTLTFNIDAETYGQPEVLDLGSFVNYRGRLEILKTDEAGSPLKGAEFALRNEAGETLFEGLLSDEKGLIVISGLAPGTYTLEETRAPEGYERSGELVEILVPESHEEAPALLKVTLVNKIEFDDTENLPATGEKTTGLYTGLLGLMLTMLGIYHLKGRKKSTGSRP